jgi:hypothetical protein
LPAGGAEDAERLQPLTVSGPLQKGAAIPQRRDREDDLKRGAQRSETPPSESQINYLVNLMRERGESASAILGEHGRLSGRDAWQAIVGRKGVRS